LNFYLFYLFFLWYWLRK